MDLLSFLSITSKLTLYIGALFASGTVIYLLFFETTKSQTGFDSHQIASLFGLIGLVSALTSYALTASRLTGEIAGAFDPEMLGILWGTPVGTVLLVRIFGFALIMLGFFPNKLSKGLALIGSLFVLGSFTQIGHVADASGFLLQALLLIHLIGVAIWVGILLPLYRLSSEPIQITTTGEIAHQFGQLAIFFVPVLLIAGGWLAYQLVSSFENLFTTEYGQALFIKIVLVTGLLGLAAANKLRFVPALRIGNLDALKHLKYSVLVEIILVLLILFVTAVLTSALALPGAY